MKLNIDRFLERRSTWENIFRQRLLKITQNRGGKPKYIAKRTRICSSVHVKREKSYAKRMPRLLKFASSSFITCLVVIFCKLFVTFCYFCKNFLRLLAYGNYLISFWLRFCTICTSFFVCFFPFPRIIFAQQFS